MAASAMLPARVDAALAFRGYCGKDAMADVAGEDGGLLWNAAGWVADGRRTRDECATGGALGLINVDDPYFRLSRRGGRMLMRGLVTLREPGVGGGTVADDANAGDAVQRGGVCEVARRKSGEDAAAILEAGRGERAAPNFEIAGRFRARV